VLDGLHNRGDGIQWTPADDVSAGVSAGVRICCLGWLLFPW
jgi:hypothetical protein